VRALLGDRDVLVLDAALALPPRTRVGVTRLPPPPPRPLITEPRRTRWRDICGWVDIVARRCSVRRGADTAVGDPALLLALMPALRGGRLALDLHPATVTESPAEPRGPLTMPCWSTHIRVRRATPRGGNYSHGPTL
jgi:hypothetical protein